MPDTATQKRWRKPHNASAGSAKRAARQLRDFARVVPTGVASLATDLNARHHDCWIHSQRVQLLAMGIAARLNFPQDMIDDVGLAGALHDIGKIGVPAQLLRQGKQLSNDQYLQVMQHTVIGERLLSPMLGDRPSVLSAVRSHHERVDGNGLPDGLKSGDIPIVARIIAVADSVDAMTHPRPYRKRALTIELAIRELEKWAGSQFDEACVRVFVEWSGENLAERLVS